MREEDGKSLLDKSWLAAKVLEDLGLGGRILLIFGGRREVENIDKSRPLLPPVKLRGSMQGLNQIGRGEKKDADSEEENQITPLILRQGVGDV